MHRVMARMIVVIEGALLLERGFRICRVVEAEMPILADMPVQARVHVGVRAADIVDMEPVIGMLAEYRTCPGSCA